MVSSQNGWVANEPDRVASQLVPGTGVSLRVRKDAPGLLLLEIASAFDRRVQDIDNARGALDDWGYAERPIRGGTALSNHASGTAIDLNATRWPLGSQPSVNLNGPQIDAVRQIVGVTGVVVRWGGDYGDPAHGGVRGSRPDPMHFEINDGQNLDTCARALDAMRRWNGGPSAPPPSPAPTPPAGGRPTIRTGSRGPLVHDLQDWSNWYPWRPALPVLAEDGVFGEATERVVQMIQAQLGVTVDGIVGDDTWRALAGRGFPVKR